MAAAPAFLGDAATCGMFAVTLVPLFMASAAGSLLLLRRHFNARLSSEIEELQRAQDKLRLAAEVINSTTEGVMVTDAHLRIESINPAFEQITGYTAAEAIGRTPKILFSGKHDETFFHRLHELVDAEGRWKGEIWNRRRNGEVYPQQTSITVLRDAEGRIRHYASVIVDNTAQVQLEAKLREMSLVDGLTGVGNRRRFDEALAREWARALRDGLPLSLLMADIDFFKRYNDSHGHLAGDTCLQQVAQAIRDAANRASDVVARYGGEEFAVILPGSDAAAATEIGERIRARVAALALPDGGSAVAAFVTISVGVATARPREAAHEADLIGSADAALYRAKRSGRNRVAASDTPASNTSSKPGEGAAA